MEAFGRYAVEVDSELKRALAQGLKGPDAKLYKMLAYFLGFLEADLKTKGNRSGKRFRPALCLLIAEAYGAKKRALSAAIAIELFHNFTLIHDDIEDGDSMRRDRPTLWKLVGVNHAINAGDVQSLMACEFALHCDPAIARMLLKTFVEVCEGQYMDFEFSDAPVGSKILNERNYLEMTRKKTGVLVGAASVAGGLAGSASASEIRHLREFGEALGTAYQIADDHRSVWSTRVETHKDTYSDVREKKRTLPFIVAYQRSSKSARARLKKLYDLPRQLSKKEIDEVRSFIDATDARERVLSQLQTYAKKARAMSRTLSLPARTRRVLDAMFEELVPEVHI